MNSVSDVKVSVCMITYNHAEFIAQAIDSVLAQKTTFSMELVIGEDSSKDQTADIVRKYQGKADIRFRARFNSPNLGMNRNFAATLSECSGEYIALLEGDDYWTDELKLQRQVDFLDTHREFSICYHPVHVLRNGRLERDDLTRDVPEVTSIRELAEGNFMHTCSVLFRRGLYGDLPQSFYSATVGDYFLHMLNARRGPIKRLPQKMAVYRIHQGGVWSSQENVDLKILSYLESMIGCFGDEVDSLLKNRHERIATKSLLRRVHEPGFKERMLRCLAYDDKVVAAKFRELVQHEQGSFCSRIRRRIWG